jgi:hypothetical protein
VEVQLAGSFDQAAERYERGRAGWPEDLLVGRVARVVAVEPLPGMRSILERVAPQAEAPGPAARPGRAASRHDVQLAVGDAPVSV